MKILIVKYRAVSAHLHKMPESFAPLIHAQKHSFPTWPDPCVVFVMVNTDIEGENPEIPALSIILQYVARASFSIFSLGKRVMSEKITPWAASPAGKVLINVH